MGSPCWSVLEAIEAYPPEGYRVEHDLLMPAVRRRLLEEAAGASNAYWSFEVPCSSFSRLCVNLNGGSRTSSKPLGTGALERERRGNQLARVSVEACKLLYINECFFSIENPVNSLLWLLPGLRYLSKLPGVHKVVFDQCEFGLCFPDSLPTERCKKRTMLLTNHPGLARLERRCEGGHTHVHAFDSVKTKSGWCKRSALAAVYPRELCRAWIQAALW